MIRTTLAVGAALAALAIPASADDLVLSSRALANGVAPAQVANAFGCDGGNLSPDFAWSGVPEGTRSFVLTAYDPDAPTGSGWWHWVVVDLPADARALPEGAGIGGLPGSARQMPTDAGSAGYLGPCPPPGAAPHRYVFALTALKVDRLDLPADASPAMVGYMTGVHALGRAELIVTYGR
jgi:Raf kinase inhibitor-like YbhB/YbcL family protein